MQSVDSHGMWSKAHLVVRGGDGDGVGANPRVDGHEPAVHAVAGHQVGF